MTVVESAHTAQASAASPPRREVTAAWLLLLGFGLLIAGLAWDAQWHTDVGPDTFFTAPHLLLYSGPAVYGLSCLAVVLLNTWRPPRQENRPAVSVLRVFRAPVAFLTGGIGAALFMLYGAADLWWHGVYGFDIASGETPSHVGLQLAFLAASAGLVMAFAALRGTLSGRWGFAAACVFALVGALPLATSTPRLVPGLNAVVFGIGGLVALVVGLVAGTVRRITWMLASALLFLALQGFLFVFSPWATEAYAEALGLSLRDYATRQPAIALAMPVTFPVVLAIGAGLITLARRRNLRPGMVMAALGALSGAGTGLSVGLLDPQGSLLLNLVAGGLFSGLLGWFGWQAAALLRAMAPRRLAGEAA